MSERTMLVIYITFTVLIAVAALAFVAWLLWTGFWAAFDSVMQRHYRRKVSDFSARLGRDCYRDTKGLTR